jgi:O-antigen/teichoic acid export membrane protein
LIAHKVSPLKKALIALYCSYAARYLTSFLSLPFLARVLGPGGLSGLAMMTSTVVAVWVEYGFGISALREISSAEPEDRGGILIGVVVAKLALFASVGLAFAVATIFVPAISQFPEAAQGYLAERNRPEIQRSSMRLSMTWKNRRARQVAWATRGLPGRGPS